MPKVKTRKAAAKRFKITGTGKILRNTAYKRHLLEHKSPTSKRQKRGAVEVDKTDIARIKSMLPGQF